MVNHLDPIDIFVLGLDDFNRSKLEAVDMGRKVNFYPLLDMDAVTSSRDYDVHAVLDVAEGQLRAHPGPIAGIIGYWDFPVSLMVPILAKRLGLIAPSVQAVLGCEHKYWSRILQKRVAPEHVPAFQSLDPFDEQELNNIQVRYPFWIKPVKSYSSHLGFRVRNRKDLALAISKIRSGIAAMGNAFNDFLDYAHLQEEISLVGGNHCMVEGLIRGQQCTLEGFVQNQEIQIYGVVDSFRYPNGSSFLRYQYPSELPRRVKQDMIRIARDVLSEIGLDHCACNMEFFWEKKQDRIWILEVNPRISQSHGDIFEKVDGTPHHRILLELALKQKPVWSPGQGGFVCAAKVFLRRFQDALVSKAPSPEEVQSLEARFPGAMISIQATQGMRLSQLEPAEQDSYSYAYAILFVGASSFRSLRESIRQIRQDLRFEFA
ncbi:MAG: ATP-grasp domain-containing protein [Desulfohalobiaceae bacterium]